MKQAAVASPATNPKLSRLLERLQEYTNIPRKMKKFQVLYLFSLANSTSGSLSCFVY